MPRTIKRKEEGRERRAEPPNCFALQEIIIGAGQVRVCPHGFGVHGSGSCLSWDCVHTAAHNSSFVGSDWDIDWEEPRQSWGGQWSPDARELKEGMSPPSRAGGRGEC